MASVPRRPRNLFGLKSKSAINTDDGAPKSPKCNGGRPPPSESNDSTPGESWRDSTPPNACPEAPQVPSETPAELRALRHAEQDAAEARLEVIAARAERNRAEAAEADAAGAVAALAGREETRRKEKAQRELIAMFAMCTAHHADGMRASAGGDYERAFSCFMSAHKLMPAHLSFLVSAGNTALTLGRLDVALELFARAQELELAQEQVAMLNNTVEHVRAEIAAADAKTDQRHQRTRSRLAGARAGGGADADPASHLQTGASAALTERSVGKCQGSVDALFTPRRLMSSSVITSHPSRSLCAPSSGPLPAALLRGSSSSLSVSSRVVELATRPSNLTQRVGEATPPADETGRPSHSPSDGTANDESLAQPACSPPPPATASPPKGFDIWGSLTSGARKLRDALHLGRARLLEIHLGATDESMGCCAPRRPKQMTHLRRARTWSAGRGVHYGVHRASYVPYEHDQDR